MTISSSEINIFQSEINQKLSKNHFKLYFSDHFLERLNDKRNIPPITILELKNIFEFLNTNHLYAISTLSNGNTFNIKSNENHINIPFELEITYDSLSKIKFFTLIAITTIRKINFKKQDKYEFFVP